MKSIVRDFIEYSGISDYLPDNAVAFKHLNVQDNMILLDHHLNIEHIIKAMAEVSIEDKRLIKTPIATSLEGQRLTGWKLIVEGSIKEKLEYAVCDSGRNINVINFTTPFSTYIILPENFNPGRQINVNGYIEDMSIKKIDKRSVFKCICLLLNAEIGD